MMTKVVDYKYTLASFSHEQIQSGSSIGSFCKNTNLIPVLDERTAMLAIMK
jgi:hypothetical protein